MFICLLVDWGGICYWCGSDKARIAANSNRKDKKSVHYAEGLKRKLTLKRCMSS